jgi:hypothetical protein
MVGGVDVECVEFLFTWVRSGMSLSLRRESVPPDVLGAEPVSGLHLVHAAPAIAGSAVLTRAVVAQPLRVLARMVDAPASSVTASLSLDAAIERAALLRLPVHVPGRVLAGVDNDFVLPLRADGYPADADTADYVLVLPASHLVAEHADTAAGLDLDGARFVQGHSLPDLIRWVGDRVQVGLPLPTARARYRDSVLQTAPAGQTRRVDGEIKGLWRALAGLAPGQAALIEATTTTTEVTEVVVVRRDPDGLVLLRRTPTGINAADLPRHPSTLHLTPITVSISAGGSPLVGVDSSRVPAVHEDPASVAERLPLAGLMLLDAAMAEHVAVAKSFRAAADEYPVFVHGSARGAMVGGFRISEERLAALIEADERSVGKTVVLVQCGGGETREVVNDYGARLFAVLTATPRVFGMGGQAWVEPLPSDAGVDELTEVRVARAVLHADGRVRLSCGGVREYVPAPDAPQVVGRRVPKVIQHGPTLSGARHGVGVALTNDAGVVLIGESAPTTTALHELGLSTDDGPAPTSQSTTGVSFPWPATYALSQESTQYSFSTAYHEVTARRQASYEAAASLKNLAEKYHVDELRSAARKFGRTHELQQEAPYDLSSEEFAELQELNDVHTQTRLDLINAAEAVEAVLRRRVGVNATGQSWLREQTRKASQGDAGALGRLDRVVEQLPDALGSCTP